MWRLNKIANKAAEAINTAKKGISETIKEEPGPISRPEDTLKLQCESYKQKIEKLENELSLMNTSPVSFRIFIGKIEETDKITENERKELQVLTTKLKTKLLETQENLNSKESELESQNKRLLSSEDSYEKLQIRTSKATQDIFKSIKSSFNTIGLTLPNIKPEDLGLEDIREFIYTQNRYVEDSIKEMNSVSEEIGTKINNFNDFRTVFEESVRTFAKVKNESAEQIKALESLNEKCIKEKEETLKINKKLAERVKILFEEIKKNNENLKIIENLKDENQKIAKLNTELNKNIENLGAEIQKFKGTIREKEKNIEGLTRENIKINETLENLNKRVRVLNTNLGEKDEKIKDLEEKNKILENKKSKAENELVFFKEDYEENRKVVEKIIQSQLEELSVKLKNTQNELKDAKIENIQLVNKAKKLTEIEQSFLELSQESAKINEKFEKKSAENDELIGKVNEKKTKIIGLKEEIKSIQQLNENMKEKILKNEDQITLKNQEINNSMKSNEELNSRLLFFEENLKSMIDKRMITTFLLNYFNDKNSLSAKKQMLRALTDMLSMTQEQRHRVETNIEGTFISHITGFLSRN